MSVISNIFIDAGADYSTTVTVTDSTGSALDLTGYSASAQIRKTYESTSATVSFTITFTSDRTTGKFDMSLTSTQTGAIPHNFWFWNKDQSG